MQNQSLVYAEVAQKVNTDRRRFFTGAIYGMWSFMSVLFGLRASAYLLKTPGSTTTHIWNDAGDMRSIANDQPTQIRFLRRQTKEWKVENETLSAWLVKRSDNSIVAFGPRCTHLGCAYHWDQTSRHFVCPCHNSVFSIDGTVISGPARRPLDRYEVEVSDAKILIGSLRLPGTTA